MPMDEKLLIAVVEKHPVIYDRSRTDFKDATKRKDAWEAVSKILNMSTPICMHVWRNIRERYAKELKILRTASIGPSVSESKWELFESLTFLKPHIKARRNLNAQPNGEIDERLLIGLVKRYPVLYDKYSSGFKDAIKKEIAWCNISRILSSPVENCMHAWKNIRERYGRERKRIPITQGGSSKWNLFGSLSFLQPHIKSRTRTNSFSKCVNKIDFSLDSTNLVINQGIFHKEEQFEYECMEETHEEQIEEMGESTNTSEPPSNNTFMLESPINLEQIIPAPKHVKLDHTSEHNYVTVLDDHTSNHQTSADIAFGNYVGQYLAEIMDIKKKNKLKLDIMQILHGDD